MRKSILVNDSFKSRFANAGIKFLILGVQAKPVIFTFYVGDAAIIAGVRKRGGGWRRDPANNDVFICELDFESVCRVFVVK